MFPFWLEKICHFFQFCLKKMSVFLLQLVPMQELGMKTKQENFEKYLKKFLTNNMNNLEKLNKDKKAFCILKLSLL